MSDPGTCGQENNTMKHVLLIASLTLASLAFGQDVQTDCTTTDRDMHCTSKTVDNRTQGQINADALAAGWKRGKEMRADYDQQRAIVAAQRAFVNAVNTYCASHQGSDWQIDSKQGHCQTDNERLAAQYLSLESRHHEFDAKNRDNMKTVCDYMEANNYDSNNPKGWDKAYKELKKQGRLHLYAKGSY